MELIPLGPPTSETPNPTTQFEFVDYDFLYDFMTINLGVVDNGENPIPRINPAGYLYSQRYNLGEPYYTGDSETTNPGKFTAIGIMAWAVSSSSACGIAMRGTGYINFNSGQNPNPDKLYLHWLSRYPTEEELDIINTSLDGLEEMWISIGNDPGHPRSNEIRTATISLEGRNRRKTAFLCSIIVNSMEFLNKN